MHSVVSWAQDTANPTGFEQTVAETPDKTRRMMANYLRGARNGTSSPIAVQDYSDGSLRLHMGAAEPYEMSMMLNFESGSDGKRTVVHVEYDASGMFSDADSTKTFDMHRAIKEELTSTLEVIDAKKPLPRRLSLNRLKQIAAGIDPDRKKTEESYSAYESNYADYGDGYVPPDEMGLTSGDYSESY